MKDKDGTTSSGFGGQTGRRLTPADVQRKEFRVSFRGYNERDVDEFLDEVTEELQRFESELMQLRSERAAFDPASFDLDAETRRMLEDARARADAIVQEAEARAAGIPTASGAETRAVVAPYLNREREFLQSLGTLVQQHANTIKTMVEEARRRTEAPLPAATDAPPTAATPPERPAAVVEDAPAPLVAPSSADAMASSRARDDVAEHRAEPEPPGEAGDVVVLSAEEPVTTRAEPREVDREPEGARSLRELFWGED
jgi:cell division initiation protein